MMSQRSWLIVQAARALLGLPRLRTPDPPSDLDAYRALMGRLPPPRVSDDHPLAWQWRYRGGRRERAQVAYGLGVPNRLARPSRASSGAREAS